MEENNKQHIVKSNNLIDCSYKLTLAEQRLINLACKKLKPIFVSKNISFEELVLLAKTNFFEPIEITVPEYKREFNIKSNNVYREMVKITESLRKKEIIYFDEEKGLIKKWWVITSIYDFKAKKVCITFHPDLIMDLLIFNGRYTKLNYSYLATTKSFYSNRMYELLRQYLNIGYRSFDIQDLRFKLGLKDTEYPRYANLKQKILEPSRKWINENSDIYIEIHENKLGARNVKKLDFIIKQQNIEENNSPKSITFQTSINEFIEENSAYMTIKDILNIDLTAEEVDLICNSAIDGLNSNNMTNIKVLDYIKEKWEIVNQYAKNKKDFNHIGALIKALKDNWQSPKKVILEENKTKIKFNNFEGRGSDYYGNPELERQLLGWD